MPGSQVLDFRPADTCVAQGARQATAEASHGNQDLELEDCVVDDDVTPSSPPGTTIVCTRGAANNPKGVFTFKEPENTSARPGLVEQMD